MQSPSRVCKSASPPARISEMIKKYDGSPVLKVGGSFMAGLGHEGQTLIGFPLCP